GYFGSPNHLIVYSPVTLRRSNAYYVAKENKRQTLHNIPSLPLLQNCIDRPPHPAVTADCRYPMERFSYLRTPRSTATASRGYESNCTNHYRRCDGGAG